MPNVRQNIRIRQSVFGRIFGLGKNHYSAHPSMYSTDKGYSCVYMLRNSRPFKTISKNCVPIGLSYFGIPMGTQQPFSSPLNRFSTFLDVFTKYEPYTSCPEGETVTPYYFAPNMFN